MSKVSDAVLGAIVSECAKWAFPRAALFGAVVTTIAAAAWHWLVSPVPVAGFLLTMWLLSAVLFGLTLIMRARLSVLAPRSDAADLRQDGTGYVHGFANSDIALLATFKNAPGRFCWRISPDESITAHIEFLQNNRLVQHSTAGCWLGARGAVAHFQPGEIRELVIAVGDKRNGFGVPEATPFSETDFAGIADILDAHRKGAYTRCLGLEDGHYDVRVNLTGSRARMVTRYQIRICGAKSWIETA